jgi:uncharacterized protein with NRDE domain
MCTVTYLPLKKNQFVLTSNRDVGYIRQKASAPKKYEEDGVELYYPKDGKAGGTWIGTSSKNRTLCLLNGGFANHKSGGSYRASRGKIVIDLLKCNNIENELKTIDLHNIEPFTLVIVDWQGDLKLMEFVWDGNTGHLKVLPQEMYIWSSSTLFTKEMKKLRKKWFSTWRENNPIDQESILKFHHEAGNGDSNVDVILKRKNVGTVSITSVKKDSSGLQMDYEAIG